MIENRSVPPDALLPHVTYQDLPGAIAWLDKAFGFREHYRYGAPNGAQVHLGNAWVMLRQAREASAGGKRESGEAGVRNAESDCFYRGCAGALRESESGWSEDCGGATYDRVWGIPVRGRGFGAAPLVVCETCEKCESGRVGSQDHGEREPRCAAATAAAVLFGDSCGRCACIGCILRKGVWMEHPAPGDGAAEF